MLSPSSGVAVCRGVCSALLGFAVDALVCWEEEKSGGARPCMYGSRNASPLQGERRDEELTGIEVDSTACPVSSENNT
jgi:hypothetical protein